MDYIKAIKTITMLLERQEGIKIHYQIEKVDNDCKYRKTNKND